MGGGGGGDGTCAAVRLIEDVRLIWGPLNTGLTVVGFKNSKNDFTRMLETNLPELWSTTSFRLHTESSNLFVL